MKTMRVFPFLLLSGFQTTPCCINHAVLVSCGVSNLETAALFRLTGTTFSAFRAASRFQSALLLKVAGGRRSGNSTLDEAIALMGRLQRPIT
jgi:hypothetical protein